MEAKSARGLVCVVAGCCLSLSVHSLRAQESPLGLYVGAGAGTATLRQDAVPYGFFGLSRDDIGWDVFIGVRPLPYLGAEIGYTDFGSVHQSTYRPIGGTFTSEVLGNASAHAPTAFAVGYLPLGLPWLDVYGKAGIARLYKSWNFVPLSPVCAPNVPCLVDTSIPYTGSTTEWNFAWGAGTEWKFDALALRLEYERVSASDGDPDLLSVGVSWAFF